MTIENNTTATQHYYIHKNTDFSEFLSPLPPHHPQEIPEKNAWVQS